MAGLALVTRRTAVQGGHGLAVKTMFRFNPSSPNKDECCGWGWLPRIREGSLECGMRADTSNAEQID